MLRGIKTLVDRWLGRSFQREHTAADENIPTVAAGAAHDKERSDTGIEWISNEGDLRRRKYNSYEEYVSHQRAKLSKIDLSQYHIQFRESLRERL